MTRMMLYTAAHRSRQTQTAGIKCACRINYSNNVTSRQLCIYKDAPPVLRRKRRLFPVNDIDNISDYHYDNLNLIMIIIIKMRYINIYIY